MTREHYNLIKLQIDLFDLNCYDFDVEALEVELFELDNLVYNLEEFIENTDFSGIHQEEITILEKIIIELRNIELNKEEL